MKKLVIIFSVAWLLVSCQKPATDSEQAEIEINSQEDLTDEQHKLSYALGVYFGSQIRLFEELDMDYLSSGLKAGYWNEGPEVFTEQEIGNIIVAGQQQALASASVKAIKRGAAFMEDYAKQEDVTRLDNGILYRQLTVGEGDSPEKTSTVEVHYEGRLVDGEVFDSSYENNQTATFPLNGVITGWQEVMPLMKVGAIWEVVIPPDLGYGDRGSPPRIGPNEVLVFKIELIDIKDN